MANAQRNLQKRQTRQAHRATDLIAGALGTLNRLSQTEGSQ